MLKNTAPNSASAAEARTIFMIVLLTLMAPLNGGKGSVGWIGLFGLGVAVLRWKQPPRRLRALGSDRHDASLWM